MAKRPPVESVDYSMDFFVKDFLVATLPMTGPERAAYALSLVLAWTQGASLPTDPERLRRFMHYETDEWARVWPALEPKWPATGDRRVNRRQLKEWQIASDRLDVYRMRALSGVAARRQLGLLPPASEVAPEGEPEVARYGSNTSSHPPPSPSPYSLSPGDGVPSSEEVTSSTSSRAIVGQLLSSREVRRRAILESFEAFWHLYPRKAGKGAVREKWKRLTPDQRRAALTAVVGFSQIWEAADVARVHLIPMPMTWLNQGRYEDDPKAWMRMAAGDDAGGQKTIQKQVPAAETRTVPDEHKKRVHALYEEE